MSAIANQPQQYIRTFQPNLRCQFESVCLPKYAIRLIHKKTKCKTDAQRLQELQALKHDRLCNGVVSKASKGGRSVDYMHMSMKDIDNEIKRLQIRLGLVTRCSRFYF